MRVSCANSVGEVFNQQALVAVSSLPFFSLILKLSEKQVIFQTVISFICNSKFESSHWNLMWYPGLIFIIITNGCKCWNV